MIQEAKKETREEAIARINAECDAKLAEIERQTDERWGPQIVPGLRIHFEPDAYMADENGKEIEGTRGHSHTVIYDAPDCSGIHSDESVSLMLDIDDRDGASVREVAAARIREEAYKLLDLADELCPEVAPERNWEPPKPKPEDMLPPLYVEISGDGKETRLVEMTDPRNTFIPSFMEYNPGRTCRALSKAPDSKPTPFLVEVVGGNAPRQVIEFGDPRQDYVDMHNGKSVDGSVARIIENPGPDDVPSLSFARNGQPTSSGA